MGTRGIIAVPTDETAFRGRYKHLDSYPRGVLPTLLALHGQLGSPEKVIETVVTKPGKNAPLDVDRTEWIESTDDVGAEWAYVLDERGINVVAAMRASGQKAIGMFGSIGSIVWESVGKVRWDAQLDEQVLVELECGKDFERCCHYAWAHFEEAEDTRVGTTVWLGREEPHFGSIETFLIGGERKQSNGGSTGTAQSGNVDPWRDFGPNTPRYWWASIEGSRSPIRVARVLKAGYRLEHDAVVPTAAGERTLTAGTVVQ